MTKTIALVGKGGTGKSTLTALILKYLLQKNSSPILVVDADANYTLPDLLNLKLEKTIGDIREELKDIPDNKKSIPKHMYFDHSIQEFILEEKGFDLLVMGQPQGKGCYCFVNNVLKDFLHNLKKSYSFILIDCEAGLEHISRGTEGDIDLMLLISDFSQKGINTTIKISELVNKLRIKVNKKYLIINNINNSLDSNINKFINTLSLNSIKYLGAISQDANIKKYELEHRSFLELPEETAAFVEIENIINKIIDA